MYSLRIFYSLNTKVTATQSEVPLTGHIMRGLYFLAVIFAASFSFFLTKLAFTLSKVLEQGWPTQLHNWANIPAPILKRAAKLLLITNSHYFTLFSSNFYDDLFFENLIFSPLYLPKAYPPEIFPTSQQD